MYGGKHRKTWSVNGKFEMMNPFHQNYSHIQALKSFIANKYQDLFISMVSFTKRCTFKVDIEYRKIVSNEIIVYDIELSEFIHRKVSVLKIQHKEPLLNENDISTIYNAFSNANITDSTIRAEHIHAIKSNTTAERTNPRSTCSICKKPVSDKVKSYCLSNKKFNGKIYCYEHQKAVF
nr:nuclease-related domain-containing protein [Bacillus oleivorans]